MCKAKVNLLGLQCEATDWQGGAILVRLWIEICKYSKGNGLR